MRREIGRPVLRWHGGKYRLAPWVIEFFPNHHSYVEPFSGAASVLLAKKRSHTEVYNDLDASVVNVFRVLRDPEMSLRLEAALRLTPFARDEFLAAHEKTDDPVEWARRMVVRSFQALGGDGAVRRGKPGGFRCYSHGRHTNPATDWASYPNHLRNFTLRLQGVVIENRDAFDLI